MIFSVRYIACSSKELTKETFLNMSGSDSRSWIMSSLCLVRLAKKVCLGEGSWWSKGSINEIIQAEEAPFINLNRWIS